MNLFISRCYINSNKGRVYELVSLRFIKIDLPKFHIALFHQFTLKILFVPNIKFFLLCVRFSVEKRMDTFRNFLAWLKHTGLKSSFTITLRSLEVLRQFSAFLLCCTNGRSENLLLQSYFWCQDSQEDSYRIYKVFEYIIYLLSQ